MARLLILDYGGVCTLSPGEASEAAIDPGDENAVVRPEMGQLIGHAKAAGVTVVVLSNDLPDRTLETVPILGDVDHVIRCSDNAIYKPDRRAFQRCLLLTGIEAGNTLLVDDQAENVAAAASLDIQTVLFHPPGDWAPVKDWIESGGEV